MSGEAARNLWAPAPRRIAVFRALALGDMLCVVPALRALRAHVPHARITLVGLRWAAEFARRFACYVDDFIAFPGACGFPEQAADHAAFPRFVAEARARRFDLAIQLHGSGQLSNLVVEDFGAARTVGHAPAEWAPRPGFVPWREAGPEIMRYLALLAALGVPDRGAALEFPLEAADHAGLAALAAEHALDPDETVCVHPGARLESRRWGVAPFAGLADAIGARGFRVALTGGPDEAPLTRAVARAMRHPALDLAGRTSLGTLAALIARARLLVANDTGVSHLAAASGTPSVIVSSGGDARRWAPLDRDRHRVLHHDPPCRPCAHARCPYAGHPCARGVEPAPAIAVALELLGRGARHAA